MGIILVLGLGGFFLYNQNITLKNENTALNFAVEEQKQTISAIKESYETQGKALNQLTSKNAEIEAEIRSPRQAKTSMAGRKRSKSRL